MTAGKALTILKLQYPDKTLLQYVDYGDRYIFIAVPKGQEDSNWLDGFYAVRKSNGRIEGFQPLAEPDPSKYFKAAKKAVILWRPEHTQNYAN